MRKKLLILLLHSVFYLHYFNPQYTARKSTCQGQRKMVFLSTPAI